MDMAAILIMWHKPFVLTFITPSNDGFTWNLASIGQAVSKNKTFENVESQWPWMKVSEWPWPFDLKVHVLI